MPHHPLPSPAQSPSPWDCQPSPSECWPVSGHGAECRCREHTAWRDTRSLPAMRQHEHREACRPVSSAGHCHRQIPAKTRAGHPADPCQKSAQCQGAADVRQREPQQEIAAAQDRCCEHPQESSSMPPYALRCDDEPCRRHPSRHDPAQTGSHNHQSPSPQDP